MADAERRPHDQLSSFAACCSTVPVLLGVATLVFSLIHLVPGDPVQAMLGESASPRDIAELRGRLGLDRPLLRAVRRLREGRGAPAISARRCARTSPSRPPSPNACRPPRNWPLAAMLVAIARRDSAGDHRRGPGGHPASTTPRRRWRSSAFRCRTSGSGPLLAIVFSVTLGWLPVSGRGTLAHLVLPAITLGAPLAAVLARMTRASLLEELRELYVLAARARGAVARARRAAARVPQQPDSDRHGDRAAVRRGADRGGDHGDDLRVARRRTAADPVDQLSRLSGRAGLHSADCRSPTWR